MKKIILFCIVLTLINKIGIAVNTDTSFVKSYNEKTIYLDFKGKNYIKNNKIVSIGRFGKTLKSEVEKISVEASNEMKSYYKKVKLGTYFSYLTYAFLALALATLFLTISLTLYFIFLGISVVLGIISSLILFKSPGHLHKSIWLYNRDVLNK